MLNEQITNRLINVLSSRGSKPSTPTRAIFEKPHRSKKSGAEWPTIFSGTDSAIVRDKFPERPEVVCGLMQRGDVANIVAAPKVGKSWLSIGLALSVARGESWLGFPTKRGKVLIVDNELKPQDFDRRLGEVAEASGTQRKELENLQHVHFRGRLVDLNRLGGFFEDSIKQGDFSLIILDALYRFLPKGVSENDNGDMTRLYNLIDGMAESTGAAIACVHHTSKGAQWSKTTVDIGSGAGAISRCVDAHLTIRAHDTPGLGVVDAEVRNFAPINQFSIAWSWPLWTRSDEAPVVAVPKSRGESRAAQKDQDDLQKIVSILETGSKSAYEIRTQSGWGAQKVHRLFALGDQRGLFRVDKSPNQKGGETLTAHGLSAKDEFGVV